VVAKSTETGENQRIRSTCVAPERSENPMLSMRP